MHLFKQFLLYLFLFLFIGCSWKHDQSNKNLDSLEIDYKNNIDTPSYQQLYIESEKRTKAIGDLKFNPSTEKVRHSYDVNGDSVSITLYHLKTRIIRIEKRIYIDYQENSFVIYDFDENNVVFSESRWNYPEKNTYINAIYWNKLIRFDIKCKLFSLDLNQKQAIIWSTKASLDSVMQFFPEFQYSFNWENYLKTE